MRRSHAPILPPLTERPLDEVLEAILVHPLCEAQRLHRMAVVVLIGHVEASKGPATPALTACSPAQVLRLVRLCRGVFALDRGRSLEVLRGSTGLWLPTNPR